MSAADRAESSVTELFEMATRRLRGLRALAPDRAERVRAAAVAELMALTAPPSLTERAID